ncbi:MAG: AzlC family ABC transporter permease [Atopobiaceae bacterium]|nr:AzlC family ABC transporter permease [Atopobiaceae bacterium]
MDTRRETLDAVRAALPVMVGYVSIGLPCGIMEQQAGLGVLQTIMLSCLFYSGAGQFMISGMWMAGSPVSAIIASVSAVSARQVLYAASLSKYIDAVKKRLALLFALGVTDETFGVNVQRFESGPWTTSQALLVNLLCCASWTVANVAGVLLGSVVSIPTAVGAFAMTSIFVCLLFTQKKSVLNAVVACAAFAGVIVCKLVGLSNPAIVAGAAVGVVTGLAYLRGRGKGR